MVAIQRFDFMKEIKITNTHGRLRFLFVYDSNTIKMHYQVQYTWSPTFYFCTIELRQVIVSVSLAVVV